MPKVPYSVTLSIGISIRLKLSLSKLSIVLKALYNLCIYSSYFYKVLSGLIKLYLTIVRPALSKPLVQI